MTTRIGNWMITASGRAFWPCDPHADEIDIKDIATALSNVCRFGGHVRFPYSVAQHSVLVAHIVDIKLTCVKNVSRQERVNLVLWGLLHDAAEAYCGDVIWPVKQDPALKAAFGRIESGIMAAICEKFSLPVEEPSIVKHADLVALATEKRDVAPTPTGVSEESRNTRLEAAAAQARTGSWHCDEVSPDDRVITVQTPAMARYQFLVAFQDLMAWRTP